MTTTTPPAAASLLPVTPGLPGFAGFTDRLTALRFRHAVDPLLHIPVPPPPPGRTAVSAPPPAGFRVLDGLWLPGRGDNWDRVGSAYLNECRRRWEASGDPRADAVRALLARLRRRMRDNPMLLRHLVLYQLGCLLTDASGGPTAEAAQNLGVHPSEAAALASAASGFPPPGPARDAGEEFPEALRTGRLHRARNLAALLPARPADPVLTALLDDLRDRASAADSLRATALRRQTAGQLATATQAWLGAARIAVDDPRARAGLLGVAALTADRAGHAGEPPTGSDRSDTGSALRLEVQLEEGSVVVRWRPLPASARHRGTVRYTVVRFPDGAPEQAVEIATADTVDPVRDTDVPTGTPLRYAVLPRFGERIAAAPAASRAVLSAPEVGNLRWRAVPDGVALNWREHPHAIRTQVWRDTEPPVPGGSGGWTGRPLPAGEFWFRVSAGYRAPDGEVVWSAGRTIRARAEQWPSPVPEVSVAAVHGDGRVDITWSPPDRGTEHLVPWRSWPVESGEDVTPLLPALIGGADESRDVRDRLVTLRPAAGTATRMTAVSVMDGRAVAGPSVLIEAPAPVTDLRVDRTGVAGAKVRFRWPEPAVLALIRWQQGGRTAELRVARSRMGADGVEIPLTRQAAVVTVGALPRPDVVVIPADVARLELPAEPLPAAGPGSTPLPAGTEQERRPWWRRLWPPWFRVQRP
ncbi:hypothetical protein [Actinacidiphila acididurans]|uniref:Uncharacterized protein n=1 Tax=Actinacidiphila acididurans TaxID=2784346 RepID=A0ABS2U659_9ACTN|nr:hypothetical protein [Actinacidiphila acididurans]MBM9510676.1 hypothetical protein [Actinacidiphila acididurans]